MVYNELSMVDSKVTMVYKNLSMVFRVILAAKIAISWEEMTLS